MQAVEEPDLCQSELEIYHAGELIVLGFGGHELADGFNFTEYRDEILELARSRQSTALALDLTAVQCVPCGLTGVLRSLLREGLEVHLFNPSREIRELLELSNLDQFVQLHELDL